MSGPKPSISWTLRNIEGCALVAHTIPVMTGKPVRIVSVDPLGRGVVELVVDRNGVSSAEPAGACATLPVSAGPWRGEDVAEHICSHIRHFPSRHRAEEFVTADARRRVLDLDTLHEHAVDISKSIFGEG